MALYKQIWLQAVKDSFYPNRSFLERGVDMSAFVDNDKINLAALGTTPEVYRNGSGPFNPVDAVDTDIVLELDTFDSQTTKIKKAETYELVYDKVAQYTSKHKKEMYKKMAGRAIWAYAPSGNTTNTPVIKCTGATNAGGFHKCKLVDIIELKNKFDALELPEEGRILVLHPNHYADLLAEDKDLMKVFANTATGAMMPKLYGFDLYQTTLTPTYDSTLTKAAYGAAPEDGIASIAYLEEEVMRADGNWDMYYSDAAIDPINRAHMMGFSCRALHRPIREIGQMAIVSL